MKSRKVTRIIFKGKKLCFMLSVMISLPLLVCVAGGTCDTAHNNLDSVKRTCSDEIAFIIDHIENTYISGRQGINDEEWNKNNS